MKTVGILSDTHCDVLDDRFQSRCDFAFAECDTIIHAGDLTDIAILAAFRNREVYAVCGNMCNRATRQLLPERRHLELGGYRIAVTHGTGARHNIEERVLALFPDVACIVFGHSHQPLCQRHAGTILINPGSFQETGQYGAPGTYAILRIGVEGLDAAIHTLPQPL
jgi:putative phosphoesterase